MINKQSARGLTFEEPTVENSHERWALDHSDFLNRVHKKAGGLWHSEPGYYQKNEEHNELAPELDRAVERYKESNERYAGLAILEIHKEAKALFRGFKCITSPAECWNDANDSRKEVILIRGRVTGDFERYKKMKWHELPYDVRNKLQTGMS